MGKYVSLLKGDVSFLKKLLFLGSFIGLSLLSFSQPYNNNWINYSQQYYRFDIAETGIYRIDSATLVNAGIPLGTIDSRNIQLFGRGVEIAIHIEGETDGVFNFSDYIEFYAQRNDGWLEEDFYGGAANHPNPYYSVINDTASYFLTWNASTSNQRLVLETDTSFSAYTPVNSFNKEVIQYFSAAYYNGEPNSVGGKGYGYHSTEGWFDASYSLGGNRVKNMPTKNAFLSGSNATLNAVVLGESNFASINGDHHLEISVASNIVDTVFEGYKKMDLQLSIPATDLGASTTSVTFKSINDLSSGADRQTVAYVKLRYEHTLDLEGIATFDNVFVEDHLTESKSYLNFSNFVGAGNAILYDLTNKKRIQVVSSSGNYKCLVPNSGTEKECYITFDSQLNNITSLIPVNGAGTFTDYSTTFVDSAFVIITHPSLMVEANNYATYRSSSINNPQNPIVVNIEELYDQFAYGIEKHPYSIRNFVDYITDNWATSPHYLFLMGKSIKANESRKDVTNFSNNLVPSYGVPASDNLLTAGLNGTINQPVIPTGRVSALNGSMVTWYLDKVIEHENPIVGSTGETDWMKKVLHFSGGTDNYDAQLFLNYLNGYKNTIEGTLFGGNVFTFTKTTTAPIQTTMSDSIKNFIGDGVAMMTFFGHASATGGFDQNIDDPISWPDQKGRYPFLLGNACLAGDIHLPSANSVSEKYVLIDGKGVIGFLASVDLGIASYLNSYSSEIYRNIAYKNYQGSIGNHIKNTIINIQGSGSSLLTNGTALGMTLHGDPSVIINGQDSPDYMISNSGVSFSPSTVTSDIDSFEINILVTNLGRAVNDIIALEVIRDYPDQSFQDTVYVKTFKGPNYQDVITFKMPVDILRGFGDNIFNIKVDALDQITELYETNNQVSVTLNIQSGEIIPIYPYKYAIVPSQGVELKASTAFPFQSVKNYVFEVDTTDSFISPAKESTTINQIGGVVSWSPLLLQSMPDSSVYYWRVSPDSVDVKGYSWRESSFQYISGKEGWGQAHFFQFKNDEYQFVKHNRSTEKFDFVTSVVELKALTYGAALFSELWDVKYSLDNNTLGYGGSTLSSTLHVAVLDSATLTPWQSSELNMGQANVGPNIKNNFFIFVRASALQMDALTNMLNDSVPNSNYILVWTWDYVTFPGYASMPANLNTAFSNLGATLLPTVQDSLPFIFFARKGNLGSAMEVIGDSINHKLLSLSTIITTNANYGNIYSEILGPAKSWDSLSWRTIPIEAPTTKDSAILNIYGIDAGGNETLLINNLPTDSADIRITSQVNATTYPFLKLNTYLTDDSLSTPPQLNRWQVTYEGVPEAALSPNIYYTFYNDTVQEGENIKLAIAVKNISQYDMDSLLISFSILDQYKGITFLPYQRQRPLLADSIIIATIEFSTFGYPGLNTLLVDVNPNNDQLEQYHFNNIAQLNFYVISDKVNPILDVTFDGIHILDRDIVSAKPEITIELTDENQFVALDDTADFSIYITPPGGIEKRVYFYNSTGQQIMQFTPASLPKNSAKINYTASFSTDGIYKLRVQAMDKADNSSGKYDYVINFEVINKSTITNIVNYPNPFTTATKFIFTLTGSEVPDIFKIQIMTITGKVVREIHKEELGAINVGRNITDFTWNGTDQYGDRLANGLYLYRVVTQINGDDIELRSSTADQFFKKGYGKMYLFR